MMRRASLLLTAITGLLACLLLNPVLAGAQRSLSPSTAGDAHIAATEGGEPEAAQQEPSSGEESAQVTVEAEAEGENEESEEVESEQSAGATGHHHSPRCVVPALQGESLSGARTALSRAHCKLGKVSEPHAHRGGLVIVTQSQAAGRRLAGGTLIAVRLSAGGKLHHRR
jgi:hypothetical protein